MNILFLCVGNSARSQIAEGLASSMLGQGYNIQSAGSIPTGEVHPNAVITMDDIGINIRDQFSKSIEDLNEDFINNLDFAITLCKEEECQLPPCTTKSLHWIIEDPANTSFSEAQLLISFKNTRLSLYKLIKKFMIETI